MTHERVLTLERAFEELERRLDNPGEVLSDIGEYLQRSTKERIRQGGPAPDGTPCAPKSPVTLANYERKGEGVNATPLVHLRLLAEQIKTESGSDWVEVGSNLVYAAVTQFGATQGQFGQTKRGASIPWGNIPARPFLGLSPTDETEIVATVEEYLSGALARHG